MSGIVGGINLKSSGVVNNSSATDGQVYTGTGAGLPMGFEAAGGGGKLLSKSHAITGATNTSWTSTSGYTATPYTVTHAPVAANSKIVIFTSFTYVKNNSSNTSWIGFKIYSSVDGYIATIGDSLMYMTALTWGSGYHYNHLTWTVVDDKGSSTASRVYTVHSQTAGGNFQLGLDSNKNTMICLEVENS